MRRRWSRRGRLTCALLALASAGAPLRAQQAVQPGDSIRVRFDAADVWHYGIITDRFGDTLTVRGCAGCRRDPFVMASVAPVQVFRARESSSGHRAFTGFILGAGIGAIAGQLTERGCTSMESNTRGPKCSGFSGPAGGLVGGLVGAVAGAISGRSGRGDHWEPAT